MANEEFPESIAFRRLSLPSEVHRKGDELKARRGSCYGNLEGNRKSLIETKSAFILRGRSEQLRRSSLRPIKIEADFSSKGEYEASERSLETGKKSFSVVEYEVSDSRVEDKVRKINDEINSLQELVNKVSSSYSKKSQEGDKADIRRQLLGCVYVKKVYVNGDMYEGDWKDGNRDGNGYYVSVIGWYYEGGWKDNKKHGQGKYESKDGSVYEGEWLDGKRNGKGKYTCVNEYIYHGQWKDDKRNGLGKIIREDGNSYDGGWKDDKMHGQGKYIFDDIGCFYEGQHKNGKKHGIGRYSDENGIIYEGGYKDGKKDGRGVYTSPNGTVYEGTFLDGKKHGKGIIYKNGIFNEVKFERGKEVSEEEWTEYNECKQESFPVEMTNERFSSVKGISMKQNLSSSANKKSHSIIRRPATIVSFIKKKMKLVNYMRAQSA